MSRRIPPTQKPSVLQANLYPKTDSFPLSTEKTISRVYVSVIPVFYDRDSTTEVVLVVGLGTVDLYWL